MDGRGRGQGRRAGVVGGGKEVPITALVREPNSLSLDTLLNRNYSKPQCLSSVHSSR